MNDLEQFIAEESEANPGFAELLAESDAELKLAMEIVRLRNQHGLTQEQLADAANMPQSMIARYEKAGRTPTLASVWRLATALNATFVFGPNHFVRAIDCLPEQLSPATPPARPRRRTRREGGVID